MTESEDQFLLASMGDQPQGAIPMGYVPSNVLETLKDENPDINLDDYFAIPTTDIDSIISPIFMKHERDSVADPFFRTTAALRNISMTEDDQKITDILPVQDQLLPGDWWRSSFMRGGAHPCWITPRNAFRQSWKFVEDRETFQAIVDNDLLEKLKKVTREFKIKEIVVTAAQVSATFGRGLAYKFEAAPFMEEKHPQWRVIPIEEQYIEYVDDDDQNEIKAYHPVVPWKKGSKQIDISPTDAVLFIHQKDPMGNGFSGIPAHAMAYKTIIRMEITTKAYVNLIHNRGMGVFLVGITAGTPNKTELRKYAQMIGNPGSRAIVFYPKNLMEIEIKEGMKMGFNYMGTDERFTRHLSMTTGIPGLRMEGEKTGAVTGSEVDQDNTAENYQVHHEFHHDSIIELYHKSDETLSKDEFCLHFPLDIKLDRAKQTQIFATEAAAVTTVEDVLTVDQVLDRLGYPPHPDPEEGKKMYSVYVNDLRNEHQIGFNPDIEGGEAFAGQGMPSEGRGGNREFSKGTTKAKERDSFFYELTEKEQDAFRLIEKTDWGRRRINEFLMAFHGSGLGTNKIADLRNELKRLEKITDED